jgi:hypothetical protein
VEDASAARAKEEVMAVAMQEERRLISWRHRAGDARGRRLAAAAGGLGARTGPCVLGLQTWTRF